jgi:RNA polymerase sigma-70 factor (ECF subfamily)
VQDTLLAVWRGGKNWRGEGEVAAWIWGIGCAGELVKMSV